MDGGSTEFRQPLPPGYMERALELQKKLGPIADKLFDIASEWGCQNVSVPTPKGRVIIIVGPNGIRADTKTLGVARGCKPPEPEPPMDIHSGGVPGL